MAPGGRQQGPDRLRRKAFAWDEWEKSRAFTESLKELFDAYETVGRCEWYIIEDWSHQKKDGGPDWDALKGHVEFFRELGRL